MHLRTPAPATVVLALLLGAGCDSGNTLLGSDGATLYECAALEGAFQEQVWATAMEGRCTACHVVGGPAQATRMVLQHATTAEARAANYAAVTAIARIQFNGVPLLLLKPTGQVSHGGGRVWEPGSLQARALESFAISVAACDPDPNACHPQATPPRIRRLSREEFDATLASLLQDTTQPSTALPPDDTVNGYRTDATMLKVGPRLASVLLTSVAPAVAKRAVDAPAVFGSCWTTAGTEADRARAFIGCFAPLAFRRPALPEELSGLQAVYEVGRTDAAHADGISLVVEAVLQSPSFLYRSELGPEGAAGGPVPLTDHEIASALSYLVTGAPPDAALLAAAGAGQLGEPDVRVTHARRLLAQDDARAQLARFVFQWLAIDSVDGITKTSSRFPEFTPALRGMMRQETETFVKRVMSDGTGTLAELLGASYTFADGALGSLYGAPGGADGQIQRVELDPAQRSGLLTQASFLSVYATPDYTSPIRRGKVVRTRVLCDEIPSPPPELMVTVPEPKEGLTTRERFAAHTSNPSCSGCHTLIDPPGFSLEAFDPIGRLRTTEAGKPVDASGSMTGTTDSDGPFASGVELARRLSESRDVHACFSRQLLQFGVGRPIGRDECAIRELSAPFEQDGKVEDLVLRFVASDAFVIRGQ